MCRFSASVFQSYCIFVSVFFNSPMPFWVDFTNICILFAVLLCVFHQKVKQCFEDKMFVMYN